MALDGLNGSSAPSPPGILVDGPTPVGGLGAGGSGSRKVLQDANWLLISLIGATGAAVGSAVYPLASPHEQRFKNGILRHCWTT